MTTGDLCDSGPNTRALPEAQEDRESSRSEAQLDDTDRPKSGDGQVDSVAEHSATSNSAYELQPWSERGGDADGEWRCTWPTGWSRSFSPRQFLGDARFASSSMTQERSHWPPNWPPCQLQVAGVGLLFCCPLSFCPQSHAENQRNVRKEQGFLIVFLMAPLASTLIQRLAPTDAGKDLSCMAGECLDAARWCPICQPRMD